MADTYLTDEEVFGSSEQAYLSEEEVFGEAPFDVPPNSDPSVGRLRTAASQVVRGVAETVSAVPKVAGIAASGGPHGIVLRAFDRIDRGDDLTSFEQFQYRSYIDGTPEERAAIRESEQGYYEGAREHPLYRAGEAVDSAVESVTPVNPEHAEEFVTGKLPRALGSLTGFIALGAAGRAAGLPAGPVVAGSGAAIGGTAGFEEALNSGATIEQAYESAGLNALVGTSEAVPIAHLLSRLDKASGGFVKRAISNALIQGTEEAVQEAFQQIMGNFFASDVVGYDPDRALLEGTGEGAALGGTAGGLTGFLFGLLAGRRRVGPGVDVVDPNAPPEDFELNLPDGSVPEGATPAEDVIGETPADDEAIITPPPSTRDGLETLLDDERPLDEIREADEQTAQEVKELDPPAAPTIPPIAVEPDGTPPAEVAPPTPGVADPGLELAVQETITNTKFTLNPEKLAKRIGAEPAAVRAILDHKAAIGEIRKTKKAGNFTRLPKRGPLDIRQFIASRGGIQDQGGELKAADLHRKTLIPGFGSLVRPKGMTYDEAREALAEAGYLSPGAGESDFTEMLEKITSNGTTDSSGKVIRHFSTTDATEVQDKVEDDDAVRMADLDDEALANVRSVSEETHGTKLTEIEAEEAAKLVRTGTHDADSAVDEVLERTALEIDGEGAESVGEERFDDDNDWHIPTEAEFGTAEEADPEDSTPGEPATEPDAGAADRSPQSSEQSGEDNELHGRKREDGRQGPTDEVAGQEAATPPQTEVPDEDEPGQQEGQAEDNNSVVDRKSQRPAKHRLVGELGDKREAAADELKRLAVELFGKSVKVEVADKLFDPDTGSEEYGAFTTYEVEGGALEHTIAISMATPDRLGTLLHEGGVHYLREIGVLNGQRWRLLRSKAAAWRDQFDIDDTYADDVEAAGLTGKEAADLLDEEAVAAAIAAYGTATRFNTRIDKIMDSIYRFFERVRSWLKGEGFNSWSDVFDEIMSGDLADEADAAQASRSAESVTQIQRQAERTDEGLFDTGSHKQGSLFQRRTTRRPTEKQMRANIARGRRAVKRVIKTKGDVTNAMRRSETGPINFYWGSKRGGIQHILKQRGEDILDSLVETIGRGVVGPEYDTIQGRKRRDIQYGKHLAVLSLDRHGEKDVWLLTGFEIDPSVESASPITARRSYARPAVGVSRNVGARDDTNVSRRRPSGKSRTKFQHKREGDSTQAGGTESNETRKKDMNRLMGKGQPLDRVMRIPFDMFGGVNEKGEWEPGLRLHKKASEILINANFSDDGRFSFLNGPLEAARAGLIDRYGLTEEYITRERQRGQDERRIMLKGAEVLKSLKDQNVGIGEARVLQAILTGEDINTKNWDAVAAPIRQTIDELGAEAVSLGLVSAESYERNRGTYLHRVYLKHEGDQPGLSKWFSQFMGGKRKKIIGDAFKGRGMFLEVDVPRLTRDDPEFADALSGRPVKGQKYRIMDLLENTDDLKGIESGKTKPLQRMFLPADKKSTKDLVRWTDRGVWEVRQMRGKKAVLWRDYTKAERTSMGEVLDARYTLGKTFMLMSHDLATGRLYADIAKNADWAQTTEPGGQSIDASDFNRIRNDRKIEWVRVPDTNISNSGGKKRWGALAGKFVRLEIWRDLNELDLMQKPSFWKQALTQWKLNKTARSPVVHMNNIMSNLMFMDMADVRLQDLVAGIEAYAKSTVIIRKQPITAPSVRT